MEMEVICSSLMIVRIIVTNKNVITINPAVPSLGKYGLSDRNYTASATNYVVTDEILKQDFG
ncbi:hypothetical protein D3C74_238300 [compost metagenome]